MKNMNGTVYFKISQHFMNGAHHVREKQFALARTEFLLALQALPEPKESWDVYPRFMWAIAASYFNERLYEDAHEYFLKVLDAQREETATDIDLHLRVGLTYFKVGDHLRSAKHLKLAATSGLSEYKVKDLENPIFWDLVPDVQINTETELPRSRP